MVITNPYLYCKYGHFVLSMWPFCFVHVTLFCPCPLLLYALLSLKVLYAKLARLEFVQAQCRLSDGLLKNSVSLLLTRSVELLQSYEVKPLQASLPQLSPSPHVWPQN